MRTPRRSLLTLTTAATMLFACGKKDPEPAPQPAAADVAQPAPEKTEKRELADKADAEAAKPAAPDLAPAPVAPPSQVAGATPPERAALQIGSVETFPADVVAVAGAQSLAGLVKSFADQAKRGGVGVADGQDPLAMAIGVLQAQAGVDLAWLDTDKPLRIAVPDPKKYEDGFVLLAPVKADAKPEAKAFPNAVPKADGHWAKVTVEGRTIFVDELDGHLVVTSHGNLFKDLGPFLKDLAAWTPKEPLVIDTSVENLVRIFKDQLDSARAMVAMLAGGAGKDAQLSAQAATTVQFANKGFALVEGTSRISFAMDPGGDFPRIGLAFRGLPGSPLEKAAADMVGRKLSFLGAVPADAWFALGYDVPGVGAFSDAESLVQSITSGQNPMAPKWTDEDKKHLTALVTKMIELQDSQSVSWMRQDGSHPLVFEGLSASKDGAALQATILEAGQFFFEKVWASVREQALASGAPAAQLPEKMDLRGFLALASQQLSAIGFNASVVEASTKSGVKASGFELKIDWARLPFKDPMVSLIGKLLGDKVGVSLGGEGKFFAAAFAGDSATRVANLLDLATNLPTAQDPWVAKASESGLFLMIRPTRLLRALGDIVPQLAAKQAYIAGLPDDPVVIQGASDGKTLSVELTLPARLSTLFTELSR